MTHCGGAACILSLNLDQFRDASERCWPSSSKNDRAKKRTCCSSHTVIHLITTISCSAFTNIVAANCTFVDYLLIYVLLLAIYGWYVFHRQPETRKHFQPYVKPMSQQYFKSMKNAWEVVSVSTQRSNTHFLSSRNFSILCSRLQLPAGAVLPSKASGSCFAVGLLFSSLLASGLFSSSRLSTPASWLQHNHIPCRPADLENPLIQLLAPFRASYALWDPVSALCAHAAVILQSVPCI